MAHQTKHSMQPIQQHHGITWCLVTALCFTKGLSEHVAVLAADMLTLQPYACQTTGALHALPHALHDVSAAAASFVRSPSRVVHTCQRVWGVLPLLVQVRTRTDLPQYNRPTSEVIRRFRDFAHLENMLAEKNK